MKPLSQEDIIQITTDFVKFELHGNEGGHDWWHIYRVCKTSKKIASQEKANLFIVELGSLLHDIADSKFNNGDETIGPKKTRQFLESLQLDITTINHLVNIVQHISFKGGKEQQTFSSPELDIIQDADRLDAIGAIGIARTFNYGGFKNRELYNPESPPNLQMTKEEYKKSTAPTINHFHEKLLLLKDRMNTKTGKKMAEERHQFLELFLEEFHAEWEGER
jgi:uncharacterized protein